MDKLVTKFHDVPTEGIPYRSTSRTDVNRISYVIKFDVIEFWELSQKMIENHENVI